MNYFTILIAIQLFVVPNVKSQLSCKLENNTPVDWYLLYKIPYIPPGSEHTGVRYMYISSQDENQNGSWHLGSASIDSTQSLLGRTVADLRSDNAGNNRTYDYFSFNNQNCRATVNNGSFRIEDYAHTKGITAWNRNNRQGLWISHSIPNFHPRPNGPTTWYPETGYRNGQMVLCITASFPGGSVNNETLVEYLCDVNPKGYSSQNPGRTDEYRNLNLNCGTGSWTVQQPRVLTSLGNKQFSVFSRSKNPSDSNDVIVTSNIYSQAMNRLPLANYQGHVQTWLNGRGIPIDDNLLPGITRVAEIAAPIPNGPTWRTSKDHSKWSLYRRNPNDASYVCVGDLNLMGNQLGRGGGLICLKNENAGSKITQLFENLLPSSPCSITAPPYCDLVEEDNEAADCPT